MRIKPQMLWKDHGDKLLFSFASLYFLLVLAWLVSKDRLFLPFVNHPQTTVRVKPLSADDKAFIAYLQAQLAMIETPSSSSSTQNSTQTPTIQSDLPSVMVLPPSTPSKPPSPSVIERIYIPLYPEIPETVQPSPPPVRSVIVPSPVTPKKVAVISPPPPKITSVPVLTPRSSLNPEMTATVSPSVHKLVGTLADGDRSYAIFQVKGKPNQVRIGQMIGQSGWILTKVENQQIVLQKKGNQRIISVGEEL